MTDLAALLESAGVKPDTTGGRMELEHISMDLIQPDENNFYGIRDIDDLANSIATVGLLEPVLVRETHDGNFKLISGHRRFAAIRKLVEEGREDLKDVPCIVADDTDDDIVQLKLIWGNLQRKKTDAEIAQEAEQITGLLYSLQQKGHKFPGRIRDHVAKAVNISTGKAATLKYIRENLISVLLKEWEQSKISTAQADALAHLKRDWQQAIYAIRPKIDMDADTIKHIGVEMQKANTWCIGHKCGGDNRCVHLNARINACAKLHRWEGLRCMGCCKTCPSIAGCDRVCGRCSLEKAQAKAAQKEARATQKAEKAAQEAPERTILTEAYRRVGQLRKEKGIDCWGYLKVSEGYVYSGDIKRQEARESGKLNRNARMPGGIWAAEAIRLCNTADLLGCSVDYLLGRTDEVTPQKAEPLKWNEGFPDDEGTYICLVSESGIGKCVYDLEFDGEKWRGLLMMDGDSVIGWMPMPKEVPGC